VPEHHARYWIGLDRSFDAEETVHRTAPARCVLRNPIQRLPCAALRCVRSIPVARVVCCYAEGKMVPQAQETRVRFRRRLDRLNEHEIVTGRAQPQPRFERGHGASAFQCDRRRAWWNAAEAAT